MILNINTLSYWVDFLRYKTYKLLNEVVWNKDIIKYWEQKLDEVKLENMKLLKKLENSRQIFDENLIYQQNKKQPRITKRRKTKTNWQS